MDEQDWGGSVGDGGRRRRRGPQAWLVSSAALVAVGGLLVAAGGASPAVRPSASARLAAEPTAVQTAVIDSELSAAQGEPPSWRTPLPSVTQAPERVVADAPATGPVRLVGTRLEGDGLQVVTREASDQRDAASKVAELQADPALLSVEVDNNDIRTMDMPAAGSAPAVNASTAATAALGDPLRAQQWGLGAIGAPGAWPTSTGAGITVAVVDTGIAPHEDITTTVLPGADFSGAGGNGRNDGHGHGTHCAGVIAAAMDNGVGITGVAPSVSLLPVKVLTDSGSGSDASVAQGIVFAVDHGANVISMSLGGGRSDTLSKADAYAIDHGVTVVAAAGNSRGSGSPVAYPAADPGVIAVAATDSSNKYAYFSNAGSYVDVSAPGVSILSSLPGNKYEAWSGTSMATPHVSAAMALVRSKALASGAVVDMMGLIESTSTDLGAPGRDNDYGNGLLNVTAMLAESQAPVPAAPTAVAAKATGNRSAVVSWLPGDATVVGHYDVVASPGGAKCGTLGSARSCNITGLQPGTDYTFTVVARNAAGASAPSAAASLRTPLGPSGVVASFDTLWRTDNAGVSAANQIRLPLVSTGTYDFTVAWGDGTTSRITSANQAEVTHTYPTAGIYSVAMNGTIKGWSFNNGGDRLKVLDLAHWGPAQLGNGGNAFYGAANMTLSADDAPDLSATTSLAGTFRDAAAVNADLSKWNVANVTDMSWMFAGASAFNGGLAPWDVRKVTDMSHMFGYARNFNQPIGGWRTDALRKVDYMFDTAVTFNQPVGSWNMAGVTSLAGMFWQANSFNQPVGEWNVSNVTDLTATFGATAFNQPLDKWDVSRVKFLTQTFASTPSFNQPLNTWNTSSVTDTAGTFQASRQFNQPIGNWDMSKVTNAGWMFQQAWRFNQPIGDWVLSANRGTRYMFYQAFDFNQPLENWDMSQVTSADSMFREALSFDQPLGKWNVAKVWDMSYMFDTARAFYGKSLATWNVSGTARMTGMFANTGMSSSDYDAVLAAWSKLPVQSKVTFDAGGSAYSVAGATARNALVTAKGWTITDAGQVTGAKPGMGNWTVVGVPQVGFALGIPNSQFGLTGTPAPWASWTWEMAPTLNGPWSLAQAGAWSGITLRPEHAGHFFRVTMSATNTFGKVSRTVAFPTVVTNPGGANTAPTMFATVVTGKPVVGASLTAAAAGVKGMPAPEVSYKWQQADAATGAFADVTGATGSTLVVPSSSAGKVLRAVATATNTAGTVSKESSATAVVGGPTNPSPTPTATPTATATATPTATPTVTPTPTATPTVTPTVTPTSTPTATPTSTPTATPTPSPTAVAPAVGGVAVSGSPVVGATLTAAAAGVTGTPTPVVSWRWQQADSSAGTFADVAGPNGASLVVPSSALGKVLRAVATATNSAGSVSKASVATAPVTAAPAAPVIGAVTVDGSVAIGANVSVKVAGVTGTPAPALTYQWQMADSPTAAFANIVGWTNATVPVPVMGAEGKYLRVVATATNAAGTATVASPAYLIGSVPRISSVSLSGWTVVGKTITVTPTASGTPTPTLTYQWQQADTATGTYTDIPGATSNVVTVPANALGKYMRVVITATNSAGTGTFATSAVFLRPITAS